MSLYNNYKRKNYRLYDALHSLTYPQPRPKHNLRFRPFSFKYSVARNFRQNIFTCKTLFFSPGFIQWKEETQTNSIGHFNSIVQCVRVRTLLLMHLAPRKPHNLDKIWSPAFLFFFLLSIFPSVSLSLSPFYSLLQSQKCFVFFLHDFFRLLNSHLKLISMRYGRNLATFNSYFRMSWRKIKCCLPIHSFCAMRFLFNKFNSDENVYAFEC